MDNLGEDFGLISVAPQNPLDLKRIVPDRVTVTERCYKLMSLHKNIKYQKSNKNNESSKKTRTRLFAYFFMFI